MSLVLAPRGGLVQGPLAAQREPISCSAGSEKL
jgi:hypothetical protein